MAVLHFYLSYQESSHVWFSTVRIAVLKAAGENLFVATCVKEKLIVSRHIDQELVEIPVHSFKKKKKRGVLAEILLCCILKNGRAKKKKISG